MNLRLHVFCGQLLWILSSLNRYESSPFQGVRGYGRNLIIKSLPPVEDVQSPVYEVFMEPYLYNLRQSALAEPRSGKQVDLSQEPQIPGLQAIVSLVSDGENNDISGELIFTQIIPNGPVTIMGNVTGLSPGLHGVHIHQKGYTAKGCKDIGPHFIAYYGRHGGPRDPVRHVGDLGNIKVEEGESQVTVKIIDHLIALTGPRSIVGRSLAISKNEDDYGRAGTEDSGLTGTSGPSVGCGVIGLLN